MARQPILDRLGHVHAYELFLRSETRDIFRETSDEATRTMIDNALVFGLNYLTCGQPAFLKCSAASLNERMVDVLPAGMTILNLHESAEPTRELISTCRTLKASGFRIALGSYCWKSGYEPLVELADYIKVDFTELPTSGRRFLQRHAVGVATALVAEKVETQTDYQDACNEDFGLFQGYYFCRPELFKNRKVPANRVSHIKIIQLLHCSPIDLREVSKYVKQDTSLTYRLLRLVNSPMSALRQEVQSIESALLVIGEDMFRRIATLAIASELNSSQSPEILRMAFVRGRFCELAAEQGGLNPAEQYLLGMLSLLPAMLCTPMDELTPSLPLSDPIRTALHGVSNKERTLLDWLEYHERGDWDGCDAIVLAQSLESDRLMKVYAEAVLWAEGALHVCDLSGSGAASG